MLTIIVMGKKYVTRGKIFYQIKQIQRRRGRGRERHTDRHMLLQYLFFLVSQAQLHSFILDSSLRGAGNTGSLCQYMELSQCCVFPLMFVPSSLMGSPQAAVPLVISTCSGVGSSVASSWISALVPGAPTLLWSRCFLCCFSFFLFCPSLKIQSFLKHVSPEAHPVWPLGSAMLWGRAISVSWMQLCPAWPSPGLSSKRSPAALLLPSPGYLHLVHFLGLDVVMNINGFIKVFGYLPYIKFKLLEHCQRRCKAIIDFDENKITVLVSQLLKNKLTLFWDAVCICKCNEILLTFI